jgi:hypothetical protein
MIPGHSVMMLSHYGMITRECGSFHFRQGAESRDAVAYHPTPYFIDKVLLHAVLRVLCDLCEKHLSLTNNTRVHKENDSHPETRNFVTKI